MLNLVSILVGIVTLALGFVAFIPPLGALNWIVIPIGVVGAGLGMLSSRRTGRNFNLLLIVVFALRLSAGGGVI